MEAKPSLLAKLSPLLVRLVALWVMTGAAYKLFSGSPNDLPPVVREFFLGAELTFKLAIAIELSIGFITLLRPRIGWILLALQMLVFILILIQLVASGEASCGCFGSKITIPPWVMMSVDALGLALILVTKPWSTLPTKEPPLTLAAVAVIASCIAPWLIITPAPVVANIDAETGEWRLPEEFPPFAMLEPETWVGKDTHETELAVWMNMDEQLDGTWILYRVGCEHCAEYLRQLYEEFDPNDPKFYTLVRLTEEGEEETRQVDEALLPMHQEALLPLGPDWVITPPWRLEVEGAVVTEAVFEGDFNLEDPAGQ
jgi:hypothetical protein